MILKIGIRNWLNEDDSTVVVKTFDNISMVSENEPQENDSEHKERLIHFLRQAYEGAPSEDMSFNIDWDPNIIFAYLMNDMGKTFKVLKHDVRLLNRNVRGEKMGSKEKFITDPTNK